MPKKMEEELRREGIKKGLTGKQLDAYIYGTMQKIATEKKKAT